MKYAFLTMALVALAATAAMATPVTTILAPAAVGTAVPSEYSALEGDFDCQPTWDGTKPVATVTANGEFGSGDGFGWGGNVRYGYIDLGTDWATWRIQQTWTGYRQWSGGLMLVFSSYKWSNLDPTTWDWTYATNDPDAVPATGISFGSANTGYLGDATWVIGADNMANPVVPAGRYLILTGDPTMPGFNNRDAEFAFVGYKIPEPATMSLLAIGGMAMLRRRK